MALIVLYRDIDFGDEQRAFEEDCPDLKKIPNGYFGNWRDETSSIKVIRGVWRFYEHADYGGESMELGPGEYPNLFGMNVKNDQLSSFKLISE